MDLIKGHKNLPLISVEADELVEHVSRKMLKYDISQIPVKQGEKFVGSLSDTFLFAEMLKDPKLGSKSVEEIMQPPFPIVEPNVKLEEISPLISKENTAVLMKDYVNNYHIITKFDIISTIK